MDMGSDVGNPPTGTQISIWPLPEKLRGIRRGRFILPRRRDLYYFAHYVVAGQDVFLYEDPGTPPKSPHAFDGLNLVSIGHIKGWLNQDTSGKSTPMVFASLDRPSLVLQICYGTPAARKWFAWASAKRASERRRSPFR